MLTNKVNTGHLVCPYDPAHTMLEGRVQTHLLKCSRRPKDTNKVSCIFNKTHQISEHELSYHLETCPDRISIDKHAYVPETTSDKYPVPKSNIENYETWEDEEVPAYDPQKYCESNPVLRGAAVQSQSQSVRREFRMKERERMQLFNNSTSLTSSQQTGQQQATQSRRPNKESEGMTSRRDLPENDRLDIAQLMAQVNLNSKVVITPKPSSRATPTGAEASKSEFEPIAVDKFPPLEQPKMTKITSSSNKMARGRGRGGGRR